MISINLIRPERLITGTVVKSALESFDSTRSIFRTNHHRDARLGQKSVIFPAGVLKDSYLGKAPLRLILGYVRPALPHAHLQHLECGHSYQAFERFIWDDGHLVHLGFPEKRRRCQQCVGSLQVSLFEVSSLLSAVRPPRSGDTAEATGPVPTAHPRDAGPVFSPRKSQKRRTA